MRDKVIKIIEDEINPVLELHSGSCTLLGVEGNDITITLNGGCVGCPSSKITLYNGIIPILKERIPELGEVILEL